MRRLTVSLFVLALLSCHAPALAQRGGSRGPIFRPPASPRGGYSPTVVRPTIPRITRPPRSLDPARRQPIPRTQPGPGQRAGAPRTGAASGAPAFRAPIPPAGSPQINAARTQAKTTLDQLRTSLRARLRSGTALGSAVKVPAAAPARPAPTDAIGQKIANGHAFTKHIHELAPFGIKDRKGFAEVVKQTMRDATGRDVKRLERGRTAYWNPALKMVVIHNPDDPDGGTAFVPRNGRDYFDRLQ